MSGLSREVEASFTNTNFALKSSHAMPWDWNIVSDENLASLGQHLTVSTKKIMVTGFMSADKTDRLCHNRHEE